MIFVLSNPGIINAAFIMSYGMPDIVHSVGTLSFTKCFGLPEYNDNFSMQPWDYQRCIYNVLWNGRY